MNGATFIPVLLLALLGATLVLGVIMIRLARHWQRVERDPGLPDYSYDTLEPADFNSWRMALPHRPTSWVAIRSRNLLAVQAALGLNNPKPCSWIEGLAGEQKLFIAPPVNGWILVVGSGLPDPSEDVDACFRFILDLSRKLGQVQYFSANPALGHHAWARLEAGRVVRAYAWAGGTLWNQGIKTRAELVLDLKCFRYCETPARLHFGQPDVIFSNTEKVPRLAAQWSLDPAAIDARVFNDAFGIAGEPA